VAALYAGTIIGAGFASGQELARFFLVYRQQGFYGIAFAGVLFSLLGFIVLDRVYSERIHNFDEFLFPMTGWNLGLIVKVLSFLFLVSVFIIMIAGSGSLLAGVVNKPPHAGAVAMGLVCMLVLMADINGLVNVSMVVSPVLLLGIITAGLFILFNMDLPVFKQFRLIKNITDNWFWSSLLYVSYNSIMSVNVLSGMGSFLRSRNTARLGGVLGGIILCVIAVIMNHCMYIYYPKPLEETFPFMEALRRNSEVASMVYSFVLWLAMTLSAVTSGYCIADRIRRKFGINIRSAAAMVCMSAVPLSTAGFSRLISFIYPVFGYLGLFFVVLIMINGLKTATTRKKMW